MSDASFFDEKYYTPRHQGGTGDCMLPYTWENQKEASMKIAHQLNGLFDLQGKKILDIGCGFGFTIKALLSMGFDAHGIDISRYAIENCEPEVKDRVSVCDARKLLNVYPANSFDVIYSSSTLEHIPLDQISPVILNMCVCSKEWIYLEVPISLGLKNEPDKTDPSHMTFMNPSWWIKLFLRYDYIVDLSRSKQVDDVVFNPDGSNKVYHAVSLVFRKERLKGDGRKLLNSDLVDLVKVFKVLSAVDQQSVIQDMEQKL